MLAKSQKRTASNKHGGSPGQERNVPIDSLIYRDEFIHMMNTEHLVIDNSLDHVEQRGARIHLWRKGSA
jgi:hypothetical protein